MRNGVSQQTRNNWLAAAAVLVGGLISALTGIYFLFLPSGGYQGGRNPAYGITILFERHTWEDLHIWFGIGMVIAVVVHFALHWSWVKGMAKRLVKAATGGAGLNRHGYFNVAIDAGVALGFVLSAVSGLVLLFMGKASASALYISRIGWDLLHTWSSVVLITAAVIHFAIHWRWVTKVTRNMLRAGVVRGIVQRKRIAAQVST